MGKTHGRTDRSTAKCLPTVGPRARRLSRLAALIAARASREMFTIPSETTCDVGLTSSTMTHVHAQYEYHRAIRPTAREFRNVTARKLRKISHEQTTHCTLPASTPLRAACTGLTLHTKQLID